VRLAGRQAGPQGEQRLRPTQRLNLGLLVQTQHHSAGWRIEVQPDDVLDPLGRLGIGREFEGGQPVGLERMGLPDAMDGGVRHPRPLRQVPGGPVRHPRPGRAQRERDHAGALPRGQGWGAARARALVQAGDPGLGKPAAQPADLHHRIARPERHLDPRHPLDHQQHRAGTTAEARGGGRRALEPLKLMPVRLGHRDGPDAIGHGFPPGACHAQY
jgi:hypothetical protein